MKTQKLFSGIVLIGFGFIYILKEWNVSFIGNLYNWQTLLIIIGLAFLFQAYKGKEYSVILPGVLLTGLGLHFQLVHKLSIWPDHMGSFLLILALGFILQSQKTRQGMLNGILFLFLAVLLLFYQDLIPALSFLRISSQTINSIFPFLFILAGGYFLLTKHK